MGIEEIITFADELEHLTDDFIHYTGEVSAHLGNNDSAQQSLSAAADVFLALIKIAQNIYSDNAESALCFNSNTIVGDTAQSFVLNIEYKKLEIFPEKTNLTSRIPEINNRFRRLRKLYTIPAEWENIFS